MRVKLYKNYKRVLNILFASDEAFVNLCNRHEGKDLKSAVDRASNMFETSKYDLKFFTVHDRNKLVGYFATENLEGLPLLSGSFVLPRYRNKKDLTKFWKQIKSYFQGDFFAALPIVNERAIKSYQKSGGNIISKTCINNEDCVFIKFSKE